MEKNSKILEKITEELFSLMSVAPTIDVTFDKESETFIVNVDAGDATGLLIGKKGETLTSIQTVLGILLKQKTGEWVRVSLNIGDYKEKEEAYLKDLANSTAERAKETGEPQSLYNLKAWQRRVIHMALSEKTDIITESQGEGEDRYLVIKSKK